MFNLLHRNRDHPHMVLESSIVDFQDQQVSCKLIFDTDLLYLVQIELKCYKSYKFS